MNSDEKIRRLTSEVGEDMRRQDEQKKTAYFEQPHDTLGGSDDGSFVWKIRLELSFDPSVTYELAVDQDMIIGREQTSEITTIFPNIDIDELGVSRKHALLRPTASVLYLLDLGSTNGSRLNTRPLGVNIPYPLMNGDMVALGRLEFIVRIVQVPKTHDHAHVTVAQDPDALVAEIACAITSQLALKDVLKQAIDMARLYTPADEVSIWLIDEMSGELFLEAADGMKDQKVFHLPVESTLAGKAIQQGKPQRTNRRADGDPIKLKTGYIAEGVIYVPLTLGDVPVGVISAVHRDVGKVFTNVDERVMVVIANLTAIAIQNARIFQKTRQDLTRTSKVVTAFHYALSQEVKRQIHSVVARTNMLQTDGDFNDETMEVLALIREAGEGTLDLVERMLNMARLSLEPIAKRGPCDLVQIVGNALDVLQPAADAKPLRLKGEIEGKPYKVWGDAQYLFYSVHNLLDNAIKFTPAPGEIEVNLSFANEGITIRVADTGPGIPEDELPDLFNRFFHRNPNDGDGTRGIGLGLEIVRTTIEAHLGTVRAHNREHGGAEFIISLPASLRAGRLEGAGTGTTGSPQ